MLANFRLSKVLIFLLRRSFIWNSGV